jgi:hypothetical protein
MKKKKKKKKKVKMMDLFDCCKTHTLWYRKKTLNYKCDKELTH